MITRYIRTPVGSWVSGLRLSVGASSGACGAAGQTVDRNGEQLGAERHRVVPAEGLRREFANAGERFCLQLRVRRSFLSDVIEAAGGDDALPVERSTHFVHLERDPLVVLQSNQLVARRRPPV